MTIRRGSTHENTAAGADKCVFNERMRKYQTQAFEALAELYGDRADFENIKTAMVEVARHAYSERSAELHVFDRACEEGEPWFLSQKTIGYTCYVDRFAGSIAGVAKKIPYLRSIGVTYLHLLAVLKPRPGENDGGFAVADYRATNSDLGTITELEQLAAQLRQNGISLCLDYAYNHTAREHEWAQRAMAGDVRYRDYYFCFEDKTSLADYEPYLGEVFPVAAPGNFTFEPALNAWVWTTFYPFQWDLNYQNPKVLEDMLANLLYLANRGVQVFRMDAAAYTWKQAATSCLALPQSHTLLRVFRALIAMAAPSVILKVEAIVDAGQAAQYFGAGDHKGQEGHIAYHNALMVSLWRSLALQKAQKTARLLQLLPHNPEGTAWVNYIRCHDDIGWSTLLDAGGAEWASSQTELEGLSAFYNADNHNYARGASFETQTGHEVHGTNGTLASLTGLEDALQKGDAALARLALQRIKLLYSVMFAQNGIPLINMGDELGLLNDYSHRDQDSTRDGRWLHRPYFHPPATEPHSGYGDEIFAAVKSFTEIRAGHIAFNSHAEVFFPDSGSDAVLATLRCYQGQRVLALANFSESALVIDCTCLVETNGNQSFRELAASQPCSCLDAVEMPPLGYSWLLLT